MIGPLYLLLEDNSSRSHEPLMVQHKSPMKLLQLSSSESNILIRANVMNQ